ncbi:hypothetical protein [Flagellimonas aequoris]|uniref:Uncharacterized protein n=1 Tax=Flagellimonas aequoris TaxID=2306997 RepID=A0A418N937_9FLAO|nr:hypothetical protein [Allomuricauda aequoris]RIV72012.1 hypothetical protein D2U88_06035 [Allomuricauda aequoris]TXK03781.1 hypothetical protein FQ019_05995 [Allomuricauda aequoris]
MKHITTLLLLSALTTLSYGQVGMGGSNLETFNGSGQGGAFFSALRKNLNTDAMGLNTVGSPYLNENFVPCKVYYKDELVGNMYYRHNAYNDEIEIKDSSLPEENPTSLATMKQLKVVDQVTGQEISMMTYENKDELVKNGYFYIIDEGKDYNLLFKKNVKFTEGTKPVNSMVRPTPNKFSQFVEFYYMKDGAKFAQLIPTNKGKFVKTFGSANEEELKDYIKEQNINLKDENDLIKVFNYLNSNKDS